MLQITLLFMNRPNKIQSAFFDVVSIALKGAIFLSELSQNSFYICFHFFLLIMMAIFTELLKHNSVSTKQICSKRHSKIDFRGYCSEKIGRHFF